ncbi:large ribosomal subunit protein mL55-like [Ciona intestinalis]
MSLSSFTCSAIRFSSIYSRHVSRTSLYLEPIRRNSTRCSISKQSRFTYPRMYKTTVALSDGSTITVRLNQPRKIIKLPMDVLQLTDSERRAIWLGRRKKVETLDESHIEDNFDAGKYWTK